MTRTRTNADFAALLLSQQDQLLADLKRFVGGKKRGTFNAQTVPLLLAFREVGKQNAMMGVLAQFAEYGLSSVVHQLLTTDH